MLSYIDRANVGNARLFGAQADTGMTIINGSEGTTKATGLTDTEWNIGLSLLCKSRGAVSMGQAKLISLVITFAIFGLPSNILVKRYGPKIVLPTLLMAVGVVLVGTGCCSSPAAWFALRLCKLIMSICRIRC